MKVRMTLGAAVAMGILVLGAIPVAASEAAQQVEVTGLEGSWRIYITPDEGEAPPVPLLATFGLGGSYVQHAGPGQSTAHGSWRRLGDRFGLTFEQYIFDPGSGSAVPAATIKVVASIDLDIAGNSFRADYRFEVMAPDGSVVGGGGGTAEGSRIDVEAL